MTAAVVALSIALALLASVSVVLGLTVHSIWKRKDTRDEQYLEADRGWKDSVRDLGTARGEIDLLKQELERKERALLTAAKLYDKALQQQVVGAPAGVLLDLVRGLPAHPASRGSSAVPDAPTADLRGEPATVSGKGPRGDLGLIEELK